MKNPFWKVWGIPVLIGICSAIGLLSALTGDGFLDLLSWITLGVPVMLTIWYLATTKKRTHSGRVN